jgi:nucleotide-binding universal stress UspA family protein
MGSFCPRNAQRLATAVEQQSLEVATYIQMKTKPLLTNGVSRRLIPPVRASQPHSRSGERLTVQKILVPTDFSAAAQNASQYALELARSFGSEVIFAHVLPLPIPATFEACPIDYPPALSTECDTTLESLAHLARAKGVKTASWMIRIGIPTHEIVEAARDLDADLIVIATHGYTSWKHFAIGSTAERVVRAAHCPVLVVREKEHDLN